MNILSRGACKAKKSVIIDPYTCLPDSNNFKYNGLNNFVGFETKEEDQEEFCECRLSDKVDNYHDLAFYWCGNKPCFRPPVRYRTDDEWEYYTILDFMRILGISPDYINKYCCPVKLKTA